MAKVHDLRPLRRIECPNCTTYENAEGLIESLDIGDLDAILPSLSRFARNYSKLNSGLAQFRIDNFRRCASQAKKVARPKVERENARRSDLFEIFERFAQLPSETLTGTSGTVWRSI